MKRLCIFVTYDYENVVDDYIGYMLKELKKISDLLVVVCNYGYVAQGIENIEPYADRVYYRKNIGFDAGAYKDTLCQYLGWDEVCKYNELLLVNDSFYGPIYPLEDLFDRMRKVDVDYWGMIRCPSGELANGYRYDSHIQSYFLAFRKNVLSSPDFKQYWDNFEYPKNLAETVITFELGCQKRLTEFGYHGTALTDFYMEHILFRENEIPYLLYPLELVRDMKIPIIKRKCFQLGNKGFLNAVRTLKYIESQGIYDIKFIEKHLLRVSQCDKDKGTINVLELTRFYHEHSKIYFYGAGTYSRNLAEYFRFRGWKIEGFLVTDIAGQAEECIAFDKADIGDDDGIIIAVLDSEVYLEILDIVEKKCKKSQIFYRKCI